MRPPTPAAGLAMHVRLLFVLLLALLTAGCFRDPVAADIEAFERYGATAVRDTVSKDIEQRLLQARTPEERVAILDEWIAMMEKNTAAVGSYRAKTPEFGKVLQGIHGALQTAVEGGKEMRGAMLNGNRMQMSDAAIKLTRGNSELVEHMNTLRRLAAERGYELKE